MTEQAMTEQAMTEQAMTEQAMTEQAMTEQAIQHAEPRVPAPIPEYCMRFQKRKLQVAWLLKQADMVDECELALREKLGHLALAQTLPTLKFLPPFLHYPLHDISMRLDAVIRHEGSLNQMRDTDDEYTRIRDSLAASEIEFYAQFRSYDVQAVFDASFGHYQDNCANLLAQIPNCNTLTDLARTIVDDFAIFCRWRPDRSRLAAVRILHQAEQIANAPRTVASCQRCDGPVLLLFMIAKTLPDFRSNECIAAQTHLWDLFDTDTMPKNCEPFKATLDILLHYYRLYVLEERIWRRLCLFAKVTHRRAKAHRGCVASVLNAELVARILKIAFRLISAEEPPTY